MLTGMRNTHGSLVPLLTIGYTADPVCSWVNHTHVNGFADITDLDRATQRHDKCQDHVGAALRLSLLGTMPIHRVVDEGVRLQIAHHNVKVRQNREVLKRLIDATAYLGMQELFLFS